MMRRSFRIALFLLPGLVLAPFGIFCQTGRVSSTCAALESLTELTIHSKVKVAGKAVSLLDLCDQSTVPDDWKKILSATNIGDAPELGAENYVYPEMLKKYLDRFLQSQGVNPSQVRLRIPDKITVESKSIQITPEQIESIFREFILKNAPYNPKDLTIQKITSTGSTILPDGKVTHDVIPASRERLIGNVTLTVNFYVDGQKEQTVRVSGRVDLNQDVVFASRPIKRDDVLTDADIHVQRVVATDIPDQAATDPAQVIGKRVLRPLGAHQPISVNDLDKPLAVRRGANVSIVFVQGGMMLSAKGETRDDGALGDTIHVINTSSRKVIMCQVMNSQTVQALP